MLVHVQTLLELELIGACGILHQDLLTIFFVVHVEKLLALAEVSGEIVIDEFHALGAVPSDAGDFLAIEVKRLQPMRFVV